MALVLYDSNILIDALKGYRPALDELTYWREPAISTITWIEVMAGARPDDEAEVRHFLSEFGFEVIQTNVSIMLVAADVRKVSIRAAPKVAVPDAIIMGTAIVRNATIITRNTKDFRDRPDCRIRVPYGVTSTNPVDFINIRPPRDSELP